MSKIFNLVGRKILIYGGILSVGVFVLLIGFGSYDLHQENKKIKQENKEMALAAANDIITDNKKLIGNSEIPLLIPDNKLTVASDDTNNKTRDLAAKVAKEIIDKNPQGPGMKELGQKLAAPNVDQLVNNLINQSVKDFDRNVFMPTINTVGFKIIKTDDPQILSKYVKTFYAMLSKIGTVDDFFAPVGDLKKSFDLAIGFYNSYIKEFYNLPVPEQLVSIHKKQIEVLLGSKIVFESLRDNYEADPMKAMLSLQTLSNIKSKTFEMYTELSSFAIKHRLTI